MNIYGVLPGKSLLSCVLICIRSKGGELMFVQQVSSIPIDDSAFSPMGITAHRLKFEVCTDRLQIN